MTTEISERFAVHKDDYTSYTTDTLRKHFHVPTVFKDDSIQLTYTHYDRVIVGGAYPKSQALSLDAVDQLKAECFLDRREIGAINIGGAGFVVVDGKRFDIETKEAIYIGATTKSVEFGSADYKQPAKFYINSAPAHQAFPSKKVSKEDANVLQLGSSDTSNERSIYQLLIHGVVETCQLQMGMTELKPGSVWNTMPVHTHSRRMEAYFYFDVPQEQAVCHFMGPPEETRHIWVNNEQAVISPPWSIHSGCGTSNYTFIWGMAGENLDYTDMDHHNPNELK